MQCATLKVGVGVGTRLVALCYKGKKYVYLQTYKLQVTLYMYVGQGFVDTVGYVNFASTIKTGVYVIILLIDQKHQAAIYE